MKFRVKVDDSATDGEAQLKIRAVSNQNNGVGNIYNLPIEIAKTKTNADVAGYISSNKFKTINGEVQFLATHEVSSTPVEIDVYKGGALVPLN